MADYDIATVIHNYESHSYEKQKYVDDIKNLIIESGGLLEGNSFYVHNTLELHPELYTKQVNLFWCGTQAERKICEIGFNAGHSCMLMLLGKASTPLDITIFDIGHHAYTKPCISYIKSAFQHASIEYIEGDSTQTMPEWIQHNPAAIGTYDVVHIDGGHSEHCISNDFKNADQLVKKGGILIIDDTNFMHINQYVDSYIFIGRYKELCVLQTSGYPHRVIQKLV